MAPLARRRCLRISPDGQRQRVVTSGSSVVFHPGVRLRHNQPAAETKWRRRQGSETVSSGVLVAIVKAGGYLDADRVGAFAGELGGAIDAGATRLLVDL